MALFSRVFQLFPTLFDRNLLATLAQAIQCSAPRTFEERTCRPIRGLLETKLRQAPKKRNLIGK